MWGFGVAKRIPKNITFVANCLLFSWHSNISCAFQGGGWWCGLSNAHKSGYPKLHLLQGCVQNWKHVCSFLCGCCKFGANVCHGTAHNVYYGFISICGSWRVTSLPMRLLIRNVCGTWVPRAHVLCPHVQNTNNPVRCASTLPQANLNFDANNSKYLPVAPSLFWKGHFADWTAPDRNTSDVKSHLQKIVGDNPVEHCNVLTQITKTTSWGQFEGLPNSNLWPLIPENVTPKSRGVTPNFRTVTHVFQNHSSACH